MTRVWLAALALAAGSCFLWAQEDKKYQEPPEEDEALVEKEYTFNPLQADKEFKVGGFYFRKGSYKAAALRYREATKWNPTFAEAYLKLGETYEKLKDKSGAREAYEKYLELDPEGKEAESIRKKLSARQAKR